LYYADVKLRAAILNFSLKLSLTGQLADKPTRGQTTRGLDNSRSEQLADWSTRGHSLKIAIE